MTSHFGQYDITLWPVWHHNVASMTSQCGQYDITMWSVWHHTLASMTSHFGQYDITMWPVWHHTLASMTSQCGQYDITLWPVWHHNVASMTSQRGQYDITLWYSILFKRYSQSTSMNLIVIILKYGTNIPGLTQIYLKIVTWVEVKGHLLSLKFKLKSHIERKRVIFL